jgi:ribosome maturation factor RimP
LGIDFVVPGVMGRTPTARHLAFGDIVKARVQVEFSRKDKKEEEA